MSETDSKRSGKPEPHWLVSKLLSPVETPFIWQKESYLFRWYKPLAAELTEEFKCTHCEGEHSFLEEIGAPSNHLLFKLMNFDNTWWVKQTCLTCGLSRLYYWPILRRRNKDQKAAVSAKERIPDWECDLCKNRKRKKLSVALITPGVSRMYGLHSVEYEAWICTVCAYGDFSRGGNPFTVYMPLDEKIIHTMGTLSKNYECKRCHAHDGSIGLVATFAGYGFHLIDIEYRIFFSRCCIHCRKAELFDRNILMQEFAGNSEGTATPP